MFYVYVIESKKSQKLYYGYTTNLEKRLKEHNLGLNISSISACITYSKTKNIVMIIPGGKKTCNIFI